jgi:RNA polymerase sigma-70 factor, ECF subfamily
MLVRGGLDDVIDNSSGRMVDWAQIIDEHGKAVWRLLWRVLGDRADADECFQETFLAALKVSERQTVESWPALLRSLATARAMDRLRQRYRQDDLLRSAAEKVTGTFCRNGPPGASHTTGLAPFPQAGAGSGNGRPTPVELLASSEPGPGERLAASEVSQRLRAALGRLPGRQAEVFCLFALDGWSHEEIGRRFGMTESAVGVTVHRARQRLRQLLGGRTHASSENP